MLQTWLNFYLCVVLLKDKKKIVIKKTNQCSHNILTFNSKFCLENKKDSDNKKVANIIECAPKFSEIMWLKLLMRWQMFVKWRHKAAVVDLGSINFQKMSLNLECRSLFRKSLINKWHTKQITLEGTLSDPMIVQLETAANTSSIFVFFLVGC